MPEDYQPSIDPDLVKALATPETPDFERLAQEFTRCYGRYTQANPMHREELAAVADLLRQVWNARGKADILVAHTGAQLDTILDGAHVTNVLTVDANEMEQAIRSLDR